MWKKQIKNVKDQGFASCVQFYASYMSQLWARQLQAELSTEQEQIRKEAINLASQLEIKISD